MNYFHQWKMAELVQCRLKLKTNFQYAHLNATYVPQTGIPQTRILIG